MHIAILLAGIVCFITGAAVLQSNPHRLTNQAYSLLLALGTAWLVCLYMGPERNLLLLDGVKADAEVWNHAKLWRRTSLIVAAFIPWGVWILKESFVTENHQRRRTLLRSSPWFILGVLLTTLCFVGLSPIVATVYNGVGLLAFVVLLAQSYRQMKCQTGIRRIEMQFLTLNCGFVGILMFVLAMMGGVLEMPLLRVAGVFVILTSCIVSGGAIAFYRVFDASHIFLTVGQRLAIFSFFAASLVVLFETLSPVVPRPADLLISVALSLIATVWLDRKSCGWLRIGDAQALAELRAAVLITARTEPHLAGLVTAFEDLLRARCHTPVAIVAFDQENSGSIARRSLYGDGIGCVALFDLGWATPESLQRRRPTPALRTLRDVIDSHGLGLIVISPRGSVRPSLILGLAVKSNAVPFTFPEVQRIQNIAELMDNILTHSRLTSQAALTAKMEHLAMMSRGLAHDLKNLITPVSSFLVHSEQKIAIGTAEEEVHAAAKRSIRVMNDYIREALFFANRFEPRFETISTGKIFESVRELTTARANCRQVDVIIASESDHTLIADAVLLQRMLGNLVFNAIDASAPGKIVTLSATRNSPLGLQLSVVDHGTGIAAQNLSRIFEPYFTTKEFGEEVRGFGLGLTISEKIALLHGGNISVQSQLGVGTVITVDLPLNQARPTARVAAHSIAENGTTCLSSTASK